MKKDKLGMFMKEKNGITLIALVVTIVVLLIISGVSISMLTGDNGIISQASKSKEETEIGYEKEHVNMAYTSAKANKIANGDMTVVNADDINRELNLQKIDAIASGSNPIIIKFNKSGRSYEINQNGIINNNNNSDKNMAHIYTYDLGTGYITGIKEEYLDKEAMPEIGNIKKIASLQRKYMIGEMARGYRYKLKENVGTYLVIPEVIDGTKICGIAECFCKYKKFRKYSNFKCGNKYRKFSVCKL